VLGSHAREPAYRNRVGDYYGRYYTGSINQITLDCPSGTVPMAANWFVNQNGDAGSHGDVSANASGPTIGDRAWTIVLKNSGALRSLLASIFYV
jgi:hypothetical protein